MVDFDPDERAFLSAPHAEEALLAAGVELETLRPRTLESFEEPTRGMRAQAYEARRKYLWRLVRDERSQIEAKEQKAAMRSDAAKSAQAKVAAHSGDGGPPTALIAGDTHAKALQQMVAQETRALERELRAEAQRQRLERKQEQAAAARVEAQAEKERQRQMRNESYEYLGEMRSARRELEEQSAAGDVQRRRAAAAHSRPTSAPPARPAPSSGMARKSASLKDAVRAKAEEAARERARAISAKVESKEAATARRREAIENERALKRLYGEQVCASARSIFALASPSLALAFARSRLRSLSPRLRSPSLAFARLRSPSLAVARRRSPSLAVALRPPSRSFSLTPTRPPHLPRLVQVRLRHEERLAGVQLHTLEHTLRTQRELEDKQHRAERERAAQRAAVGKVSLGGGGLDDDGGDRADAFEDRRSERTSKVRDKLTSSADLHPPRGMHSSSPSHLRWWHVAGPAAGGATAGAPRHTAAPTGRSGAGQGAACAGGSRRANTAGGGRARRRGGEQP